MHLYIFLIASNMVLRWTTRQEITLNNYKIFTFGFKSVDLVHFFCICTLNECAEYNNYQYK